jgi:feruloyl esterase
MPKIRSVEFVVRTVCAALLAVSALALPPLAPPALASEATAGAGGAARCAQFGQLIEGHWPDRSTQLARVQWQPAATGTSAPPAHCELIGELQQRVGEGGQHYAIRFHLRLPDDWNGRFLFQGGGGSNGVLGDALGNYSPAAQPALLQGYAVVSQDSGHDNDRNNDPARGGINVFGFDAQARANYGHASLPLVSQAAKAAVKAYYGKPAHHAYFVGCSKGGAEGMAFAQRYPAEFDGIVANAPGFSLPRAAVAQAWDTQSFVSAVPAPAGGKRPWTQVGSSFSAADLSLVRAAVLAACDADDGVRDGLVADYPHCTPARVQPELAARTCGVAGGSACLAPAQAAAFVRMMAGPHDSKGRALYVDWAWDPGVATSGWRGWKLGSEDGREASRHVTLGGASLATEFTTPPTVVGADPQSLFDYLMGFDFDSDASRIYATNAQFPRSAWADISARSSDLVAFRKRGGHMIVAQGLADPVFSVRDTLAWWQEVDHAQHGQAGQFVRVFPVPGMNHCRGGDATDEVDELAPLVRWVEQGVAPDSLVARAGPGSAWPGRTRPLCPFPKVARYGGSGDPEQASSFRCE